MTRALAPDLLGERVDELAALRRAAGERFFEHEAERIARLCHRMAERFARGGRLVAVGASPQARSDTRHIAVEFVHPVIVGKRALPALGLAREGGELREQLGLIAEPDDIVVGFGDEDSGQDAGVSGHSTRARADEAAAAVTLARGRGCLTLGFGGVGAEWEFEPPGDDACIRQELAETLYHLLWELVHVFFEHRGLLEGREARPTHDTGAASFLYPFLGEQEHDLEAIVADVRTSVVIKAAEIAELRAQTLSDGREALVAAAADLRARLDRGGRVLALGNGGSATDAMDLVADLRRPPRPDWEPRAALDLTEDTGIITAIANDVGVDSIFARQVIAYGREPDVLVALSTSGNSENVIKALAEARRSGLGSVAMVGYDGGRIATEGLADHVIVTRSEHIPRIQEAQASAYHALRELVELSA